jgi:hypothetical protein
MSQYDSVRHPNRHNARAKPIQFSRLASRCPAPAATASITRWRKSTEYSFGIGPPKTNQCRQTRALTTLWDSVDSRRTEKTPISILMAQGGRLTTPPRQPRRRFSRSWFAFLDLFVRLRARLAPTCSHLCKERVCPVARLDFLDLQRLACQDLDHVAGARIDALAGGRRAGAIGAVDVREG